MGTVPFLHTQGNIKNTYDYDVWGNFLTKQETVHNPFTYFCQTYDETTGLYYLRARYYDPTTGRFTQQDPAEDGYNWYVYGNNNPVIYADYSGLYYLEIDENGQVYAVIESGDTLSAIAKAEVNDASAYLKMTGISDYNNIYVGQRVNITGIYNANYKIPVGIPNSSQPIYDRNGNKIGERYYGPDGNATHDIDETDHGNPKHHPNVPHQHEWGPDGRGPETPVANPQEPQKNNNAGFWQRTGAVVLGTGLIIYTLLEDVGSYGGGMANDAEHFQQGFQSIMWGFYR